MWDYIKTIFSKPKTPEQAEEEYIKSLIKIAKNPSAIDKVASVFKTTIEKAAVEVLDNEPPGEQTLGMLEAIPWLEIHTPEIFSKNDYYMKMAMEINSLFLEGKKIRIPGVAFNKSACGWRDAAERFARAHRRGEKKLPSEKSHNYLQHLIKEAKK
jgi:hypothetical protein